MPSQDARCIFPLPAVAAAPPSSTDEIPNAARSSDSWSSGVEAKAICGSCRGAAAVLIIPHWLHVCHEQRGQIIAQAERPGIDNCMCRRHSRCRCSYASATLQAEH